MVKVLQYVRLHTQIISVLLSKQCDFYLQQFHLQPKHLWVGTICPLESEKVRTFLNDYTLPNTKKFNEWEIYYNIGNFWNPLMNTKMTSMNEKLKRTQWKVLKTCCSIQNYWTITYWEVFVNKPSSIILILDSICSHLVFKMGIIMITKGLWSGYINTFIFFEDQKEPPFSND
jgi:hypothetical protein